MKKKNNTTKIVVISVVILAIVYFAYVNQNIAGQAAFRNQNVEAPQGNVIAAGYLRGSQLCIGTDCRSSWPAASTGMTCTIRTANYASVTGEKTLACSGSEKVYGGGCRTTTAGAYVRSNYPSDQSTWTCGLYGTGNLYLYANCCS